jgi:hypothetical protein
MLPSTKAISQNRNQHPANCCAVSQRPIEYLTENGFSIFRVSDSAKVTEPVSEFNFLVRDPHGYELTIKVKVAPSVIREIAMRTRGRLPGQSSYWICVAERHLATYLWENDDYPADAQLIADLLTLEDFDMAMRWECE